MRLTTFFILLFFLQTIKAQIYLADTTIKRINFATGGTIPVCPALNYLKMFDIALSPNGKMYGISFGSPTGTQLYEIDTLACKRSALHNFGEPFSGLVVHQDGTIYLGGEELVSYNPSTGHIQKLGVLPSTCAGDMVFWGDTLIIATLPSGLIWVDPYNPSQLLASRPLDQRYFGLGVQRNCISGKTYVYAFHDNGKVARIDPKNRTYELIPPLYLPAGGATSPDEFIKPFPRALDTVVLAFPDCGASNGRIEVFMKPGVDIGPVEFSLDGNQWQKEGVFTNLQSDFYVLRIRAACGVEFVRVLLQTLKAPTLDPPQITPPYCTLPNGRIEIRPQTGQLRYSMDAGTTWQNSPIFENVPDGDYTLWARDTNGCQTVQTIHMRDSGLLAVQIEADIPNSSKICIGEPVHLKVTSNKKIQTVDWFILRGDKGQLFATTTNEELTWVPDQSGLVTFKVKVADKSGCQLTFGSFSLDVLQCPQILPNAFTPNGDGLNDTFGLLNVEAEIPYQLEIFNRWGQKVFVSTPQQRVWDGNSPNGEPAPSDVYVYRLVRPGFVPDVERGDVTLIR